MVEFSAQIGVIEAQIERALWDLEVKEELEKALTVYQEAETKLCAIAIPAGDPSYPDLQRVLAYCLMRQSNLLRQMQRTQEAFALSEREIAAARLAGHPVTLARSLMSNGVNHIVAGQVEKGLAQMEEARALFAAGENYDHRQGLGWYWILQADLANAGLTGRAPSEVIEIASRALEILLPIENWPGVRRALAARAKAHESAGNGAAAEFDRQQEQLYKRKVNPDP